MLSAFFSGTELALMSLADHKIDSLVKSKKIGAQALRTIKENNDRLLITILIWNNLVNTFTAAFATSIAIWLANSSWLGVNEATAIGIATGIVTFLLLLFGEIIPKSIATKNAAKISLTVAPIYKFLMFILYPVISFMELIIKVFSWSNAVEQMTDDEIESFIDMGKKSWSLEDHEHEKIKNILEFDETTVEEIMTPRVKIEALPSTATIWEAMDFYLTHTHSRIPVYNETIDKIDYVLTARELVKEFASGNTQKSISDIKLKKVLKVPLNQSIAKLLETFQQSHKIMAIIIDEYGGVSGLITMEDIIEEVFGEIRDESDKEIDEIKQIGVNSIEVESDVLIEDILEELSLDFEHIGLDERDFSGETLSYVITHILEDFPKSGQIITLNIINNDEEMSQILQFKILWIEDARIWKVEVKIIENKKTETI